MAAVVLLVATLLILGVQFPGTFGQLVWRRSKDPQALCNDFTRAGYFVTQTSTSDKWVIFLESGGLCFSNDTCNRRFFQRGVRERFNITDGMAREFPPYGNFNPSEAWNETSGEDQTTVINPLMTSAKCFVNRTDHFPDGLQVEGRDMLDKNCSEGANPQFCNHTHVLIPYCSSDSWLGNETNDSRDTFGSRRECDCFDRRCFQFEPRSANLQFTFRGKRIFQSVFRELLDLGMRNASEVVLVGSSAGGLGVLNHAKWVKEQLPASTELLVIFDSSWFINFQGNLLRQFDGTVNRRESNSSDDALLSIIESHPACNNIRLGYPCCLSAQCLLTERGGSNNSLLYFPEGVPSFGIFGLYDVFLLAPSIRELAPVNNSQRTATGYALDFLRTVGEYGGAMNETLAAAVSLTSDFSFYVTECFQHIYFATSTLWGMGRLFGNGTIEVDRQIASFTHLIQSGIWNTRTLAIDPANTQNINRIPDLTIQLAIKRWYENRNSTFEFRDACVGPYCNNQCPEIFTLGELTSNNWPIWGKILIVSVVVAIVVCMLFTKTLFVIWLYCLERKQNTYIDQLQSNIESSQSSLNLEFPECKDEDLVSVACLDLKYSVTIRLKKVKDEKQDNLTPVVLRNIPGEDGSEEEKERAPSRPTSKIFPNRRRLRRKSTQDLLAALRQVTRARKFPNDVRGHSPSPLPTPHKSRFSDSPSPFPQSQPAETETSVFSRRELEILKGISIYFNPGELIGIMGPSGCGKTTFLDLLTGRRKTGTCAGSIYVNGIPMDDVRSWYVAHTGYVLQLATPYYEELTVRENLTLAAQIKLPNKHTAREKFERVEQVMAVTGLAKLADIRVGGATGPGLSGGQKRRLAVALQLLKLPSVIFLDEPTSGLDAASSFELLSHLNNLADSKRTVILTIHQPRLEIFHMFHRLMLLSDGKVAYHGVPEKAYEVFVSALKTRLLDHHHCVIPELEDHNPADVIMDMLGTQKLRRYLTEFYQSSNEPNLVKHAIKSSIWKEQSSSRASIDTIGSMFSYTVFGARKAGRQHAYPFSRCAALEARATKRASIGQLFYLPVIFFAYGVLLGTVYFQQTNALLVMSGFCVYSVASALFMFPALYLYYQRALEVYGYERADGVGRASDLVIQGFVRFITMAAIPVVVCAGVLYVLLVNVQSYSLLVFGQLLVVNMALNQTWTALLIALICSFPNQAFRLSPVISSIAGFTSGFFIPVRDIPWPYRWLTYINPNYYGFSSSAFLLLSDFNSTCPGSQFECYTRSGPYVLSQFGFDTINPYLHITILLSFTIFYLLLAVLSNWVRHTVIISTLKRVKAVFSRKGSLMEKPTPCGPAEGGEGEQGQEEKPEESIESPGAASTSPLSINGEVEGGPQPPWPEPITPGTRAKVHWRRTIDRTIERNRSESESQVLEGEEEEGIEKVGMSQRPSDLNLEDTPRKSLFLREGDGHKVWKPKRKRPQLYDVVKDVMKQRTLSETSEEPEPEPEKPVRVERKSLWQRQRRLVNRLHVTQLVFKEQNEALINEDIQPSEHKKHLSLRDASKRITENLKRQKSNGLHFTDIVSQYIEQQSSTEQEENGDPPKPASAGPIPSPVKPRHPKAGKKAETPGVVPLNKWRQICRQQNHLGRAKTAFNLRNVPVYKEKSEETRKQQQHPPADRTRSEPKKAQIRRSGMDGGDGSGQGTAGVSSGKSPMIKSQSAVRRAQMQKQANVAESTDSGPNGDVTLMDARTPEERFFDLVQDQFDEYNSLQQSGTLPQTGASSKTGINVERPISVPVGIGTSSESLSAQGSTESPEQPSSTKSSGVSAAEKQSLALDQPPSTKSSVPEKQSLTLDQPPSTKSSVPEKQSLTLDQPPSTKSSVPEKQSLTLDQPPSTKSSVPEKLSLTLDQPPSTKSSVSEKVSLTLDRPPSKKSFVPEKLSLTLERPPSTKSSISGFSPNQALGDAGRFGEDSMKVRLSPKCNRVKLAPTYNRPPIPPAFTMPRPRQNSKVSLKSDSGFEGQRRRSVSPELEKSTFV